MSDLIPISTVTDAAATRAAATPSRGDQLDKDAFLRLLVAQLKYQNPLSPSDPNQFMAQTAQFTMVEKLEQLAADAATQRQIVESSAATALLGRTVTWRDAAGVEHSGVVTGATYGSAGATLVVGDERPPLSSIVRVDAPAVPAAPDDTSSEQPTEATQPAPDPEPTTPAQEA